MNRKTEGTVSYLPGQVQNVTPMIKVSGQWLKEYGFMVGDKIDVLTEDGKVIIQRRGNDQERTDNKV